VSIIERAAKRLEELRNAGITVRSPKLAQDASSGFPSAGIEPAEALPEDSRVAADARPRAATEQERLPTAVSKSVSIDLARLAASGFVTPEDPRSQLAEEFRVIKRPLIRNAMGKSAEPIRNGNLIMITSAFPGEGKSTCAVNLAISIATEYDSRVLLVDADVAKPSIPALLGLSPERGLLDLLIDRTRGPLMLELNARPGLAVQLANRDGLQRRLELIDRSLAPGLSGAERVALACSLFP